MPQAKPDLKKADEAAEFYDSLNHEGSAEFNPVFNLATAYLATRAREAKLEAVLREVGKCKYNRHDGSTWCEGGRLKYTIYGRAPEHFDIECPNCKGTGLVLLARELLKNDVDPAAPV